MADIAYVAMVWTCASNSRRPLKVWRIAMTPTLNPCFALIHASNTPAASAGRASTR